MTLNPNAAEAAESPAPLPADTAEDGLSRRVAVLMMVVTLLGSVFAFLQTSAANRAALAVRHSETAAVESMGELSQARSHIATEQLIWMLAFEEATLGFWLSQAPVGEGEIGALAQAFDAQREAMVPYSDLAAYQRDDGSVDGGRFVGEALVPSSRAAEYQKAYAAERGAWGAKGGAYIAVVTVLAVALFLIGLSRTVSRGSGRPLVVSGAALAGIAAVWGFSVFLRPVAGPSPTAIDAYVQGGVALSAALWETDPGRLQPVLVEAEEAFTRAIEAQPGYTDAYSGRAAALFQLDLLQPDGPTGSEQAAEDWARVVSDNPLDPVAWGNLGAARFWLGDLAGAGEATRRALAIDPDDPTYNLNLGLFLTLVDETAAYQAQLARIEEVLSVDALPSWLRALITVRFVEVLDLAEADRAESAEAVRVYREEVLRIAAMGAEVTPLSFTLSADRTTLQATFDVAGVVAGERWWWRSYRGGIEDATLSHDPEVWSFAIPGDQVTITLTLPDGFAAGMPVRVEVFIEGNLLQAGEYTP